MKINEGPLTERQTKIIEHVIDGKRQKQIAEIMGVSISVVRQETINITRKMGVETSYAAMAKWKEANAYRWAAIHLRNMRAMYADNPEDKHVNHVLEGLANLFDDWANQRMPK